MDLIFGGAYQGKLDWAKGHWGIKAEEIYTCPELTLIDSGSLEPPVLDPGEATASNSEGFLHANRQKAIDDLFSSFSAFAADSMITDDKAAPPVADKVEGPAKGSKIKVIDKLEYFTLACVFTGIEAKDFVAQNLQGFKDKILIVTDISGGLVPMEAEYRAWREMNGRLMLYLSKEADSVTRIFCGLPQMLK